MNERRLTRETWDTNNGPYWAAWVFWQLCRPWAWIIRKVEK